MIKRSSIVFLCLTALLLPGCVLNEPPARNSKFVGDYAKFVEVDENTLVYRHPQKKVVDYAGFYFSSVTVYSTARFSDGAKEADLKALGETLRQRIIQEFQKDHPVVDHDGPGILNVMLAISDIKPVRRLTKADGTEVTRYDAGLKGSKFEVDCFDSVSKEQIFGFVNLYNGEQYVAYEFPEQWSLVEKEFVQWVAMLKAQLDRASELKKKPAK